MARDDISLSNAITTGRREEEQDRLEGKAPSTEQQEREKEADDFYLTLQESDVSGYVDIDNVELIIGSIKEFENVCLKKSTNVDKRRKGS